MRYHKRRTQEEIAADTRKAACADYHPDECTCYKGERRMKCQCEHETHYPDDSFNESGHGCSNSATKTVYTIYGAYELCATCANQKPCLLEGTDLLAE